LLELASVLHAHQVTRWLTGAGCAYSKSLIFDWLIFKVSGMFQLSWPAAEVPIHSGKLKFSIGCSLECCKPKTSKSAQDRNTPRHPAGSGCSGEPPRATLV